MAEFVAWPKTQRLFRDIIVSEKMDGTNAGIDVELLKSLNPPEDMDGVVPWGDGYVRVTAQSRKRLIYPGDDNFGFAAWVRTNQQAIADVLGPGLHFGEWWGIGIQRGYGVGNRRFSLFNTDKWKGLANAGLVIGDVPVAPVPVMYHGTFSEDEITRCLNYLRNCGSVAVPGFDNPEGVCVWHSQTRSVFKVTLDNYDAGKWESA